MYQQQISELVLDTLQEGIVPWQHPVNDLPEFRGLFGTFISGEPHSEADYGELENIIGAVDVKTVLHGRVKKPRCERPPREKILLPPKSRFLSEAQFRATLIHEVLHALEQPHRAGWIGSDHQAELVCEVGTGFVLSHLRLPPDPSDIANIVKWLPAWTEGIRANPAYLFAAVAQAERAVRYLLNLRRRKAAA